MTFEQVMDLQYRKLLTARDLVRDAIRDVLEDSLLVDVSDILLLAQLLPDLDSLDSKVLLDVHDVGVLGYLYDALTGSDDPAVSTPLPPEDVEHILGLVGACQLPDDVNREVALRFADAANEMVPDLCIGRDHLAELLR